MALNALRQGAKSGIVKFILMGFMTMAVAGLVLMDMGGFFRGGVSVTNVAKIGGQPLSSRQFDNIVRNNLSRQGLDTATAYQLGLINQILQSEINTATLNRAAYELGIRVDDDLIAEQVSKLIAPFVTDEITPKEALQRILANQRMSEHQFTQTLRMQIANTMLKNAIQMSGAYMSEAEINMLYSFQNESRTFQAILLPNKEITEYKEPTDEVLLPFYQAGQERYAIPETRSFTVAVLGPDDLENTVSVTDDELREIYESEITSFERPEQRKLSQAVFTSKEQALAVTDALAQQDNKNLEETIKTVTGSDEAYLGTDSFEKNGLVEDIAAQAFTATPGDVIGPIETPLGHHVLVLKEIIAPATQPFEDVKDQLRRDILMDRSAEQIFLVAGEIDDMLAGGRDLESVAGELNMTMHKVGPVLEDGSTPQQTEGLDKFKEDSDYILEMAFEAFEGESSPVIELSDGGLAVVRLDTITPKSYKPFEDVRDSLSAIWIADQQEVLNKQRARDMVRALANGDTSLEALADETQKSIKTYTLKRSEEAAAPLLSTTHQDIFTATKDTYIMSRTQDGFTVGTVTGISLPDVSKMDSETEQNIATSATRNLQNSIWLTYLQSLRDDYDVSINETALKTLYGPASSDY